MDADAAWFYATDDGNRLGPVAPAALKGAWEGGDIDGLTLVWRGGMPEWKPLGEVPELKQLLGAAGGDDDEGDEEGEEGMGAASAVGGAAAPSRGATAAPPAAAGPGQRVFYYADPAGAQAGPVTAEAFPSLVAAGQVTPSTLVWGPPLTSWEPLSAVPELVAILQGPGGAGGGGGGDAEDAATAGGAAAGAAAGKKRKRDAAGDAPRWRKAKVNPWVYVTGLPPDATEEEVAAHFRKAGLVKVDPATDRPRVKLYRDAGTGAPKGDGSVCYVQEASVELAVQLLDGLDLRPGYPLTVEPAQFEKKEGHTGAVRKKKRAAALTREEQAARIKELQQRVALSWAEEGDESAGLRVVVLKNLFTPEEMQEEGAADELAAEVAEEATKLGEVVRLSVFSQHPDGPILIRFRSAGAAVEAISAFNGRFFGGRRITCEFWDGKTDYRPKVSGDAAAEAKRIDDFGKWLEEGDG